MAILINKSQVTFTAPDGAQALIGDFTDGLDRPIPLQAGSSITLEFPRNAYVEYAFLDTNGTPFADPNNPKKAQNPWYAYFRAIELEGYTPNDSIHLVKNSPKGKITQLEWIGKKFPGKRRAHVYIPPKFDAILNYPMFFVQDGTAFYRVGKMNVVMDNLLHLSRIKPAILVFLEPSNRTHEYFFNQNYLKFLLEEAIPTMSEQYALKTNSYGLWGASLGGLASLYAAFERPDVFSMVVTQSGAFQGVPGNEYGRHAPEWLVKHITQNPQQSLRISQDCGQFEWLLGTNRRMAGALSDKGYAHQYIERASGHNWVTWRNGIADHLEFILG